MNFNTFLDMYNKWQDQPHMYVVNNNKMKHVRTAYSNLENIIHEYDRDAKVEIEINEFNDGSASISVETDDIVVQDISKFITIIEHASNFEVYPLINGNMKFAITFNDIMTLVR